MPSYTRYVVVANDLLMRPTLASYLTSPATWQITDLGFLRKARVGKDNVIASGSFALCEVRRPGGEPSTITAEVGATVWALAAEDPIMRLGDYSYAFSATARAGFYVMVLSSATEPEALGILEALFQALAVYQDAPNALPDLAAQMGDASAADEVAEQLGGGASQGAAQRSPTALAAHGGMVTALAEASTTANRRRRPSGGAGEGDLNPLASPGFRLRLTLVARQAKAASKSQTALGKVAALLKLSKPREGGPSQRQWQSLEQAGLLVLLAARQKAEEREGASMSAGTIGRMLEGGGILARRASRDAARQLLRQMAH